MKRIGKYLRIRGEGMKTRAVVNNDGEDLGCISYFNNWRQYVFEPEGGDLSTTLVLNHRCLTDIAAYLMTLNKTKGAYKVKS